jgi:hypothetical protein
VLLPKLGMALSQSGLSRQAIFGEGTRKNVFAYYVDENNASKFIRESFDGVCTTGQVVDGKFRAD